MKQEKMYRYLGKNGLFTTHVELLNINPLPMIKLIANEGYYLTNGEKTAYSITIFPEEVEQWYEMENPNYKKWDNDI
jgi:hypothetical protein